MIECLECRGTGSSKPDCYLCNGYRTITIKKAYRHGYKLRDLSGLEDDGYCDCPACEYEARTCMFCYGDGRIDRFVAEQQQDRVLIAARHGQIPPVFDHDPRTGAIIVDENIYLLSRHATAKSREEGLLHWFCTVFGDELQLTPKGVEAAKHAWRRYRSLCRQWVAAERERRAQRAAFLASAKAGINAVITYRQEPS